MQMQTLFEIGNETKRVLKNPLNDLNGKEWVFNTNSVDSFESRFFVK